MNRLGITYAELLDVMRTCVVICPADPTPPYLQAFITARLAEHHPELAAKICLLGSEQMDALCELIVRAHALTWQEAQDECRCRADSKGPGQGTHCW